MTETSNRTGTAGILLHLFAVGIVAIVTIILFGAAVFSPLTGNKSFTEVRGDRSAIEDKTPEPLTAIGHEAGSIPAEAGSPGSVATKMGVPSDQQNSPSDLIEKNTKAKPDLALAPQA